MILTFLGTGPTEPVISDSRKRSSLYIEDPNFSFIIDCSLDFLEQTKKYNVDKIDFILQTHAHSDAMGGLSTQLKEWMKAHNVDKMPVYVEKEAWDKINDRILDTKHIEPIFFKPYTSIIIVKEDKKFEIKPFRLTHSIQPGFPTVGFRFNDITYSEDVGEIPKESENYYKNANLIIFDAAMWFKEQIKGHKNVEEALETAKKYNPKFFFITQAGHTYPKQSVAEVKIQDYWNKIKEKSKTKIKLAYDGLKVKVDASLTLNLLEKREGICLTSPYGKLIWEGKKSLIIKSKLYRNSIGKLLYLLEDDKTYGIIKLKTPYKIDVKEFIKLKDKHKITTDERKKWWFGKKILFAYPFEKVKMFKSPKSVDVPKGATFINDFSFLTHELIQDINDYSPDKLSDEILIDDLNLVTAWYSTKKQGKYIIHSFETIENLAKKIYEEIKRRKIGFNQKNVTLNSSELFDKILKGDKMEESQVENEKTHKSLDLTNYKLLEEFKDMTIIKDFISIIGSYAEQRPNHTPNDIDLLIRMAEPTEFIKRSIEVRILKMLDYPKDWENKIHFVWGDPEGPHDTYIPMYDLVLKKNTPLVKIEMIDDSLKKDWIEPEEYYNLNLSFYPMKPGKKFYEIHEATKYAMDKFDKSAIELKYNGFRGILEKKGNDIKMYSDETRDISKHFKIILVEADSLSSKDYTIDGEIVIQGGGRAQIAKFITGKGELDDSKLDYHTFDIISYDGEDVSDKPWHERKSILHSLNFGKHIKEVRSIIVDSVVNISKAIDMVKDLPLSEGAVIKDYNGKYTKGISTHSESDAWIKYRISDPINMMVLDVFEKENGYSYKLGIHIDKEDTKKFEDDYIEESSHGPVLVLGNSFVTKLKFEKDDHIVVKVEEVWRHKYKDGKIRYSIHKPTPIEKTKDTSKWSYLDNLAVSKGEEVIENEDVTIENFVVKKGDKWCVVHGHPQKPGSKTDKPKGTIIKCFPTKEEADRMHKAIIISKIKRGEMAGETTTSTIGVPSVQGSIWKYKPIKKQEVEGEDFNPKNITLNQLKERLLLEANKYYNIKDSNYAGSLENTILIGKIVYDELLRRGIKITLPEKYSEYMDILKEGKTGIINTLQDDFGESRGDIAKKFWNDNWQDMYPKDGKGKFVYQNHWRGLSEEEAKTMSNEQLLNTNHSIHGDLRFEINPERLFGFTVFTGTAEENKSHSGNKLIWQSENKGSPSKLQGDFKLPIPYSWLEVGKSEKGTLSPPKGVGSTSEKWAKFFAIDSGTYEMGVAREHMRELFFNGDKLKGRAIIQYAPVGEGGRKWLIDFPTLQDPYIKTHNKEDIIKELKRKGQRWLIWAGPGIKPEKIDIEKWSEEKNEEIRCGSG